MMPDQRLHSRVGNLMGAPLWLAVPIDEKEAFTDRVFAVDTFADLSDDDKALIRRGELEVSAGLSPVFQDPATWGDWSAIEAALDSGDDAALDRALEGVGPDAVLEPADDGGGDLSPDDEAELALYDDTTEAPAEAKSLAADDDGWVG